jgi:hypothetical protein
LQHIICAANIIFPFTNEVADNKANVEFRRNQFQRRSFLGQGASGQPLTTAIFSCLWFSALKCLGENVLAAERSE